ncbi:MAG: Rrf2 family transcriptional regulator [bacterium]|nr:Rrf2 family transcriptional regulator [bacterium]MDT8396784.1 Rrf2 family transcriptional regulator [bacterium]
MKITKAADYAVRCCQHLSGAGVGVLVSRREVSEAMDIPSPFLGKIAQQLTRDGIIEIVQGARGGYRLLVGPTELSLLRIIEAVMGPVLLNACALDAGSCTRSVTCSVHGVWKDLLAQFRQQLDERKIADLLN